MKKEVLSVKKTNGDKFECYSKKLYGFLVMKGIRYDRTFKHNETQRICWVYTMTEELSKALLDWKMSKPN